MLPLLLAIGGAHAADLEPRRVHSTHGDERVCWNAPDAVEDAFRDGDVVLRLGSASSWRSQRCARTDAAVEHLEGEETVPITPAGPFDWHGPPLEAPLLPSGVQDVARGPDGSLWLARCRQGVTRLDPERGTRHSWTTADGLPPGCVTEVDVDADGRGWLITPDRAARLDPATGLVRSFPFATDDRASVAALEISAAGLVWLGGQGGRLRAVRTDAVDERANPTDERRFLGERLAALGTIDAIREGPDGRLWLSSRERITVLDPEVGSFAVRVAHGAEPGLPSGRPGPVVFAPDGAWVLVLPDRPGEGGGDLVRLEPDGRFRRLVLPGLPARPLRVEATADGALWLADGSGVVRVDPERAEARRVAVGTGFVSGGPWVAPGAGDSDVWASFEGTDVGATLTRLSPDGSVLDRIAPAPLPPPGVLVRTDDGVLLATSDGAWVLDPGRAGWRPHPGFGGGLRRWSARRLAAVHTGPSGRTWLMGEQGLRVGRVGVGWEDATPPDQTSVEDVHEHADGSATIVAGGALFARDRLGRYLRAVDDGGRAVDGVERLEYTAAGVLWAWGPGGAWTVTGSDAVRRLGAGVGDLVSDADRVWAVRADGVRVSRGGDFERVALPRFVTSPSQVAARDGELVWVRARGGLWRRDGDDWVRLVGADGALLRSTDGTLWRWDPDGLHVLPADASTWRWVGLGTTGRVVDKAPVMAADAVTVLAMDGVLAVEVEGRIIGDATRRDPIVDLDVHGTRWAALSRRGVLLRGDGYRVLERTTVPGPARRVALGPHRVCVGGTAIWCRSEGRWATVFDVLDLPAPLPAVDLDVDEEDRVWSLYPGALCTEARGCVGLRPPNQTSLLVHDGVAWVGSLQGLLRVEGRRKTLVRPGEPVLDVARDREGALWLAGSASGVVRWTPDEESTIGWGDDPRSGLTTVDRIAVSRAGHVWIQQNGQRHVRPAGERPRRWPWTSER